MLKTRKGTTMSGYGTVIIIAVIAVAALIIAWMAFNRSGEDFSTEVTDATQNAAVKVETGAEELAAETNVALARAEARAELMAIKAELEAEESYGEVVAAVDEIEADLAAAYENASVEAQTEWEELQAEFSELRTDLQAGAATSLEVMAGLILELEAEVEPGGSE